MKPVLQNYKKIFFLDKRIVNITLESAEFFWGGGGKIFCFV